ncbi:MAG TPA: hypothetical protein VFY71_15915 [Planctomycetota bacterium]|nr:hypothetical protein [Planctomycetota bacterium]
MTQRPQTPSREAPPAGLAERIADVAAPELDALAVRARRRSRLALVVLLGVPTLMAAWQFALLAARPLPPAPRPDARWLAQLVGPDGRFTQPDADAQRSTPVGLHGLALLALARADGDASPSERAVIARAADWLLAQQAPDGGLADADQDHALGTLALVTTWVRTRAPELRAGAERAVACLLQREAWGAPVDGATAAWSLQALLAAQDAGLAGDAAAAVARTRTRLAASLGGLVDREALGLAALSPQAAPRQAALGPLYVASVALLAAAPPDAATR